MREIDAENAADYLRETGRVAPGRAVGVRALGGGVSNVVLRVDPEGAGPFVLKQARARLRTRALWVSRLERIWTERAALDLLGAVLPGGTVPRVLFSDEPNFLFAMTCAPEGSVVWKERLLAGDLDPAVARRAGEALGTVHAATRGHPGLAGRLADTAVFDELRTAPFYRAVAAAHPEVAPRIAALTAPTPAPADRCLVLGDFSPKNILAHPGGVGLTLVDFETAHAGDPSYDLGFFLSHLWLKAVRAAGPGPLPPPWGGDGPFGALTAAFLDAYRGRCGAAGLPSADTLPAAVVGHLYACALARVDGTSPVDYLDEAARRAVRGAALGALRGPPPG